VKAELAAIFGGVGDDPAAHAGDRTENEPRRPAYVVEATRPEQVAELLKLASERGVPVTPKVTGENIAGLAIPAEGGIVLDLHRLNAVEIDPENMVAWIEPGVTWQQLKEEAARHRLRLGFPLAPPDSSVLACALMDGLSTMALPHGSFADWITGVVAYLADGTRVTTGSAALSGRPLSRGPLPDLTGMFVNWFGTTGVVVRLGLTLWPDRPRRRDVIACRTVAEGVALLRRAGRAGHFHDLAGIGWPAAKWALGLERLGPRDPAEPELYVIAEYETAPQAQQALRAMAPTRPVPVTDLVKLAPDLALFAELPARFGFLLDHEGGGLTWVGTFGPMERLAEGAGRGMELMERHGHPPLVVMRPMKGGHFAVLRFIERFDRSSPVETDRVRQLNVALGRMLMDLGYVPYKCPAILYDEVFARLDPGFRDLMERLKRAVDPRGILNPDRWRPGDSS
jgi:FAD/FMN-containing dehydrogenase